jgi:hypothetical protein
MQEQQGQAISPLKALKPRTPKVLSGFITSSVIIGMLGPDHA